MVVTGLLDAIELRFPATHAPFTRRVLSLLQPAVVEEETDAWRVAGARPGRCPHLSLLGSCPEERTSARFAMSDRPALQVPITNTTGIRLASPERYQPIALSELERRVRCHRIRFTRIDHVGFNLPWFSGGIHPRIEEIRRALAPRCLYHTFPTGEPWDFILPGTPAEIGSAAVDYEVVRRPKFEIVSFEKCSRPIVQIDVGCDRSLTELEAIFPEALMDHVVGNAWVYVDSPLELDPCLVIGPHGEGDWSDRFKECRVS